AEVAIKLVVNTKRAFDLPPLAHACRIVLARLPAGAATPHAQSLATHIVQSAAKTTSLLDLLALAKSLRSIDRHLPADCKETQAFVEILFRMWEEAPEERLTEQLAEAIGTVAGAESCPPAATSRGADRVLAALNRTPAANPSLLANLHEMLLKRLPADDARTRRVAAIRACIHAETTSAAYDVRFRHPVKAAPATPRPYLVPLVSAYTTSDLVTVLLSPSCTGNVESWFLAELGRRCRCIFRSAWDVPRLGH